jgi:hypothetical protein
MREGEIFMRLTTVKRSVVRYGAALGLIISTSLTGSSMVALSERSERFRSHRR